MTGLVQDIFLNTHVHGKLHLKASKWYESFKQNLKRGEQVLGNHLYSALYTVCSASANRHFEDISWLQFSLGIDVGDTQLTANIMNDYLKQIRSYFDMVFAVNILHGKHPKSEWDCYLSGTSDKGTVGSSNLFMFGLGCRDGKEYKFIIADCPDTYDLDTDDIKITFGQGRDLICRIMSRFKLSGERLFEIMKCVVGDQPLSIKGRPYIFGILAGIVCNGMRVWVDTEMLESEKEIRPDLTLRNMTYEEALRIIDLPFDVLSYTNLDFCHSVSILLKNLREGKVEENGCNDILSFFEDISRILNAFNRTQNTGKRHNLAKKHAQSMIDQFVATNGVSLFKFQKIGAEQETRFDLHQTKRAERCLRTYGTSIALIDEDCLDLWLADSKVGVSLLLAFYSITKPLEILQLKKQQFGLPGWSECRFTDGILEELKKLANIKTIRDIENCRSELLLPLKIHLKDLTQYKFGGISLQHSPQRLRKQISHGSDGEKLVTIEIEANLSMRDVTKFISTYASSLAADLPLAFSRCRHPWCKLAINTIDIGFTLRSIVGENEIIEMVRGGEDDLKVSECLENWEALISRCVSEDPRLRNTLGVRMDNGALLVHFRTQMLYAVFSKFEQVILDAPRRWFFLYARKSPSTDLLSEHSYTRLSKFVPVDYTVNSFKIRSGSFVDCYDHFTLNLTFTEYELRRMPNNKKRSVEKLVTRDLHVVPDIVTIVQDLYDEKIRRDILGPRLFLIIFDLVNAKTMNVETAMESYFSILENQKFGRQDPLNLVNRGIIKSHVGDNFHFMSTNMRQLAALCRQGVSPFGIQRMCMPLTFHTRFSTPTAFVKYSHAALNNMYSRVIGDKEFIRKCLTF